MIKTLKTLDVQDIEDEKVHNEIMSKLVPDMDLGQRSWDNFIIADVAEWDDNFKNIIRHPYPLLTEYLMSQGISIEEPVLILIWW